MGGTANEIDYTDWALVDITPANGNLRWRLGQARGHRRRCSLGVTSARSTSTASARPCRFYVSGTARRRRTRARTYLHAHLQERRCDGGDGRESSTSRFRRTRRSRPSPSTGATCVTPAVGGTGTIVCTSPAPFRGPRAASPSTVNIDAARPHHRRHVRHPFDQETALTGNKITTEIGCLKDTDCRRRLVQGGGALGCTPRSPTNGVRPTAAHQPDAERHVHGGRRDARVHEHRMRHGRQQVRLRERRRPCTAATGRRSAARRVQHQRQVRAGGRMQRGRRLRGGRLVRGATPRARRSSPTESRPTDGPHTNPTLNGTCTAAAGILVCVSAVCDTKDNECGYANGDGPCTVASDRCVARRRAAPTHVRPAGGCNVDAMTWPRTGARKHAHCTAEASERDGGSRPIRRHQSTLNGTCTAAAGALWRQRPVWPRRATSA